MKIGYLTIIIAMVFITMTIFYNNSQEYVEPETLLRNMSNIPEVTFNVLNDSVKYYDLYNEEPTILKIGYNIIHGILYGVIVEVNTLIPISVYIASGEHSDLLMQILMWYIIIVLLFFIPTITKAIFIIYFFVKEKRKRKDKERWID